MDPTGPSSIHNEPRNLTHIIFRTPTINLQQTLQILPRRRFMPSSFLGPSALEAAAPLVEVGRPTFHDENAVVSGDGEDAVEMVTAGERGVEDDREAEADLRGGDAPEGVVGEVVEGGSGGGGGEREGGVADVVFVEERAAQRGGYGFCYGGFPCAWVPLHRYYHCNHTEECTQPELWSVMITNYQVDITLINRVNHSSMNNRRCYSVLIYQHHHLLWSRKKLRIDLPSNSFVKNLVIYSEYVNCL
uniref:Uncharacterized protein n=1 Tax=Opuntia streptacantha TaxID=393608 RepID=A0A7C8YL19_OPUST